MGLTLGQGDYHGTLLARRDVGGFILTETAYGGSLVLPRHRHEHAYLCWVLEGGYAEIEIMGGRALECGPSTLVIHPAGAWHANRFGNKGGRCFNVEVDPARLAMGGFDTPLRHGQAESFAPGAEWLLRRLYREFHAQDAAAALAIEGLALELLAELSRGRAAPAAPACPPWLAQATDTLRARFEESLSVRELAQAVGVHPVHLARAFRQHHGLTPGEYLRQLRVDSARHLLLATDLPLVEVALSAGFHDQSHFCRVFKRATGRTPAQFRATARPR